MVMFVKKVLDKWAAADADHECAGDPGREV
jgi:hypothetical protein